MTANFAEKTCTPCRGGMPPLTRDEAESLHAQAPDWQLVDDAHRIERTFRFRNFREALDFVQEVGELAVTEGHHPDISFGWGYAAVSLSTEKIKGLPVKDFIMASGCSIARTGPSTSSSEKRQHELANLNHGGNERSHRHRVRRNRLSRPPHRSASALLRISGSDRVKASGSGAQTVWS